MHFDAKALAYVINTGHWRSNLADRLLCWVAVTRSHWRQCFCRRRCSGVAPAV